MIFAFDIPEPGLTRPGLTRPGPSRAGTGWAEPGLVRPGRAGPGRAGEGGGVRLSAGKGKATHNNIQNHGFFIIKQ